MAEEKEQQNPSGINMFTTGLNTDIREYFQPEGTYRYALNVINNSSEGQMGSLISEPGNTECFNFEGYPIGYINISDKEIIYFLKDPDEIVLANSNTCTYISLVKTDCLNFQKYIHGVYKMLRGCERIIYFVDGINPDRVINIDAILKDPVDNFYTNGNGVYDCELFKEKPDYFYTCFSNIEVLDSGGNLKVGSYEFIIQYEDSNGFLTPYFLHTLPIPISFGRRNLPLDRIMGGDDLTYPPTNKSILLEFSNLDPKYAYVNLVVGYTDSLNITSYYKIASLSVPDNGQLNHIFSNLNNDQVTRIDAAEVTVPRNPYDISKTITHIDDRLIKANLKSTVYDYSKFQLKANDIKVSYFTKPIHYKSAEKKLNPKFEQYYKDYRSYLRDEVYSLGIVWVFNNGTESPVFHIPGRQLNKPVKINNFPNTDTNDCNRSKIVTNGWDNTLLSVGVGTFTIPDAQHIPTNEFTNISTVLHVERWKIYNTAHRLTKNTLTDINNLPEKYTTGELSYWESIYDYPDVEDCSSQRIFPSDKIRHHKMPDTNLEEHFIYVNNQPVVLPLGLEFNNIQPPAEFASEIQGYYIVRELRNNNNKTVIDKGIYYNNWKILVANDEDDGIPHMYNLQPTTFNRHRFPIYSNTSLGAGLIPVYSSIDVRADETSLFTADTGESLSDLNKFRRATVKDDYSAVFHGPGVKFNQPGVNANHFKTELHLRGNVTFYDRQNNDCDEIKKTLIAGEYTQWFKQGYPFNNNQLNSNPLYLNANEESGDTYLRNRFLNNNQQEALIFETTSPLNWQSSNDRVGTSDSNQPINAIYGSMKNYSRTIYGQLNFREYVKTHNCLHTGSTVEIFGGDTFINSFSFMRSHFDKMIVAPGSGCNFNFEQPFNYFLAAGITFFGPGIPIVNQVAGLVLLIFGFTSRKNTRSRLWSYEKNLVTYFVESDVNVDLRHVDFISTEKDNTFWPYYDGSVKNFLQIDWFGKDGNPNEGTGGFSPFFFNTYAKNKLLYNPAYSKQAETKKYFTLSDRYQYCSECEEIFENRIIYSENAFEEERVDYYRIFLANNYKDLPAATGEITRLFVSYDNLQALTERTMYVLYTNPNQIQTDTENVFVGTGQFLSLPAKELVNTDYGYMGCSQPQAVKVTENGVIFLDTTSNSVFLIGNVASRFNAQANYESPVKQISLKGMKNFFENNMSLEFNKAYKNKYGVDYPLYNQPSIKNGIGFHIGYDLRYKRLLITKIDYKPLSYTFPNKPPNNYDFNNPVLFENKSWTISFSLMTSSFVSFHSYTPNFYSNDSLTFYSSSHNDNYLWKHINNNFQKYYGNKYNYIIDYIIKDNFTQTFTLETLNYLHQIESDENVYGGSRSIQDVTFNDMIIYNSYQSTGKKQITNKVNPFTTVTSPNNVYATNNENTWSISNIRDEVNNLNFPLFTDLWQYTQSSYPIDKVPYTFAFQPTKSVFELEMLRDKYFGVRLFFNTPEDYKMIFDISSITKNPSIT